MAIFPSGCAAGSLALALCRRSQQTAPDGRRGSGVSDREVGWRASARREGQRYVGRIVGTVTMAGRGAVGGASVSSMGPGSASAAMSSFEVPNASSAVGGRSASASKGGAPAASGACSVAASAVSVVKVLSVSGHALVTRHARPYQVPECRSCRLALRPVSRCRGRGRACGRGVWRVIVVRPGCAGLSVPGVQRPGRIRVVSRARFQAGPLRCREPRLPTAATRRRHA